MQKAPAGCRIDRYTTLRGTSKRKNKITYPFSVRGQTILLDSCSLAAALARLPEQTQEEIFLYYFQHLTQKEIGEQSGWTRSTIGRHIRLALKRLKEEMEVLSHE